ncbi:integrin alpha [Streptomyces sp. E2N166]|uniref:integrin alpha n=1 Tax=Streptomyces sp. E2N166 TaxID=1851909 RepID=UPI001EE89E30|nr:integrin alpha [Streptomyces sp. E2N166]
MPDRNRESTPSPDRSYFVALDTGDVNGDGYADVVAGAPRADVYGEPGPGRTQW